MNQILLPNLYSFGKKVANKFGKIMQTVIILLFLSFLSIGQSSEIPALPEKDLEIDWSSKKPYSNPPGINSFCQKMDKKFLEYGWGASRCDFFKWNHIRNSVKGDPLIWTTFGDENKNHATTLVLCGVHGDEITPNKFCFDIIFHLQRYSELYKNQFIIVAPFVSPDSFFSTKQTRTNAHGVDVNRNFPTKDWDQDALKLWKNKYGGDLRRFPGKKALSEPEVIFQVNLIKRYRPDKILSVHAPLTLIDFDGPIGEKGESNNLLLQMSKSANGYAVRDYPFFPGSLGNWAGNELGIPTFTLELPSSDNRRNEEYWKLFRNAIHTAFFKDLRAGKVDISKK